MLREGYKECEVLNEIERLGLSYDIECIKSLSKRDRGRPRKIKVEELSEIEVSKVYIEGEEYLRTRDDVILDVISYEIKGILKSGKICK